MDALIRTCVNSDLPRYALASSLLVSHSEYQLKELRALLFEDAKTAGLTHSRDVLVKRLRKAVGPPLPRNYVSDVADLSYALKNRQPVPRSLLKNGKLSATVFVTSRNRQVSTTLSHVDNCVSSSCSLSPVKCPDLTKSTEHSAPVPLAQTVSLYSHIHLQSLKYSILAPSCV